MYKNKCLTCSRMLMIMSNRITPSNRVIKILCCCDMRLPNISQNIAENAKCAINHKILNNNSIFCFLTSVN